MKQESIKFSLPADEYPSIKLNYSRHISSSEEFRMSIVDVQENEVGKCLGSIVFEYSILSTDAIYELTQFKICENLPRQQILDFLNYAFISISEKADEIRLNGCNKRFNTFCRYDGNINDSYLSNFYGCQKDDVYLR